MKATRASTHRGRHTWCWSILSEMRPLYEMVKWLRVVAFGKPGDPVDIIAGASLALGKPARVSRQSSVPVFLPVSRADFGFLANARPCQPGSPRIAIGHGVFLLDREGVAYLDTTDLFGRGGFFLPVLFGGLRASLTALPA
jgi:hypothetical protein